MTTNTTTPQGTKPNEEVRRLFDAIKTKRDRAIFAVAYRHGLRASEVGILQLTDVDLKASRITIDRVKGSLSGTYPLSPETVRVETSRIEAQRWEAEARSKESQSKVRISTIDLMAELLDKGVKADDLPRWQAILTGAGVSVEALAAALEEYGSIESLVQAKRNEAVDLEHDASGSEAQVQALDQEREGIVEYTVQDSRGRVLKHGVVHNTVNSDALDETFSRLIDGTAGTIAGYDAIAALSVPIGTDNPSDGVDAT